MIIYKTTNLINGKFYIGQDTKNNPKYLGSGKILKMAINKYGKENFIKEVLEYCQTKNELNKKEKFWIKYYNATNFGYNIAEGGHGGGKPWNENQRILHKKFMKNKFETDKEYSKIMISYLHFNWMKGKNHSKETKQKMSIYHKNNPISFWKGKKLSESHKKNISEGLIKTKFKHSKEHKDKITGSGNPFYGHAHSEETKKKMSEARRNKTPEQKLERYINFYKTKMQKDPPKEILEKKYKEYEKTYYGN